MRWKIPKRGDTRTKTRFLLFPKIIDDEVRWLEVATWVEIYKYNYEYAIEAWRPLKWIERKD